MEQVLRTCTLQENVKVTVRDTSTSTCSMTTVPLRGTNTLYSTVLLESYCTVVWVYIIRVQVQCTCTELVVLVPGTW